MGAGLSAEAAYVKGELEPGVAAVLHNGRQLFLEVRPSSGRDATPVVQRYLIRGLSAAPYANKGAVAVPFSQLNPDTKRRVLLAVFTDDYVDEEGWHHFVRHTGPDGHETLWTLCEWLTGTGFNFEEIKSVNRLTSSGLEKDQRILFPRDLLQDTLKEMTPARVPPVVPEPPTERESVEEGEPSTLNALYEELEEVAKEITFKDDAEGAYAVYRLKKGEALYSAVVVRFTDIREHEDIMMAAEIVQRRSGISDVFDMPTGQLVKIPLDMLSDRFKPKNSPDRLLFEEVQAEADRLKGDVVQSKGLANVVVVLDSGHGGVDPGTQYTSNGYRLYEDELNYDIVCRIKRIIERDTQAKVYVTVLDPSQGFKPVTEGKKFVHDKDEVVLTTPNYRIDDIKLNLNLRSYLANSHYRKELARGVDPRNVVFVSVHCDALYETLRGAMVYIPGSKYRYDREQPGPASFYSKYKEYNESPEFRCTAAERLRDEALSRNFAEVVLQELGNKQIRRHKESDPIRNVIRRSETEIWLPAVLRNTIIPTKVLIETANLNNSTDQERLSDPEWRELFAEGFVEALKVYYGS